MAAGFKTAQVNASLVPSTQTNFPSYVDLSRLGITTLAEAQSVRVYADSAKTTEWAREIVSATEMHVKVPSLTSTVTMYVDWDGVSADYAVTDTFGRNAVWNGQPYLGVWHLDGTDDSTGNGNNFTNNGSVPFSASKIGNGAAYGASNTTRWLNTSSSLGLDTQNAGIMTISGLVNFATLPTGGNNANIYGMCDIGNPQLEWIYTTAGELGLARWNGSSGQVLVTSNSLSTGVWYKVDFIKNGTAVNILVDGTSIGTHTITSANGNGSAGQDRFAIGRHPNAVAGWVKGSQDEVRITGTALSTDWLLTEYNNQNNESSFWGTWSDAAPAKRGGVLLDW